MSKRSHCLMALFAATISCAAAAQEEIDLAKLVPGTTTRLPQREGEVVIKVLNIVTEQSVKYDVTVKRQPIRMVMPLDPFKGKLTLAPECSNLKKLFIEAIVKVKDEKKVRTTIATWRKDAEVCSRKEQAALNEAIAEQTTRVIGIFSIALGEELVVTIERREGNKTTKTWTVVYSTGARGMWNVSYGFIFIPNEDEEFFTEQSVTDPTKFTVKKQRDEEHYDFAPSIFFNWMANKNRPSVIG